MKVKPAFVLELLPCQDRAIIAKVWQIKLSRMTSRQHSTNRA